MQLLLEGGADVNVQSLEADGEYVGSGEWDRKNVSGETVVLEPEGDATPLHMAIDCEAPNDEMIRLLLSHRAGAPGGWGGAGCTDSVPA